MGRRDGQSVHRRVMSPEPRDRERLADDLLCWRRARPTPDSLLHNTMRGRAMASMEPKWQGCTCMARRASLHHAPRWRTRALLCLLLVGMVHRV